MSKQPSLGGRSGSRAAAFLVPAALIGTLAVAGTGWAIWQQQATAESCSASADWPFASVSCELFETTGQRARDAEPADFDGAKFTAADIEAKALERYGPGARVREVQLVRLSGEASRGETDLGWAAVVDLPGGPTPPNGSAIHSAQLDRVKQAAGTQGKPITAEEEELAGQRTEQVLNALRESTIESFHMAFFDPQTGEWLGATEATDTDEDRFAELAPEDPRRVP